MIQSPSDSEFSSAAPRQNLSFLKQFNKIKNNHGSPRCGDKNQVLDGDAVVPTPDVIHEARNSVASKAQESQLKLMTLSTYKSN